MENIPNEIIIKITTYLDFNSIYKFKNINKNIKNIIETEYNNCIKYVYLLEIMKKNKYNQIKYHFNDIGEMQNNIEIVEEYNSKCWKIYHKNILIYKVEKKSEINISVLKEKSIVKQCSKCKKYWDSKLFSLRSYKNKFENKRECYNCLKITKCLKCNNIMRHDNVYCYICKIHEQEYNCARCFITSYPRYNKYEKDRFNLKNYCKRCFKIKNYKTTNYYNSDSDSDAYSDNDSFSCLYYNLK